MWNILFFFHIGIWSQKEYPIFKLQLENKSKQVTSWWFFISYCILIISDLQKKTNNKIDLVDLIYTEYIHHTVWIISGSFVCSSSFLNQKSYQWLFIFLQLFDRWKPKSLYKWKKKWLFSTSISNNKCCKPINVEIFINVFLSKYWLNCYNEYITDF